MELLLNRLKTASTTTIEVSDAVFGLKFNEPLVHQIVTAYLAGGRQGSKAQKTRAQVRGGGRKPWRQKGTGRARAGTSRSPLWRGGGRTFAASPQDHTQKVNRKMYRGAMRSIFSELVRQNRFIVVDAFQPEAPKTRSLLNLLKIIPSIQTEEFKKNKKIDSILIITDIITEPLSMASHNLPSVALTTAMTVDPLSLVDSNTVLITIDALRQVEERFKNVSERKGSSATD